MKISILNFLIIVISFLPNSTIANEIWKESFYSEGVYSAEDETEDDGKERAAAKLVVDILNRTTKDW